MPSPLIAYFPHAQVIECSMTLPQPFALPLAEPFHIFQIIEPRPVSPVPCEGQEFQIEA